MNLTYRRRPRRTATTLMVTFILGIGAGFSLFYALADAMGWNFGPESVITAPHPPTVETAQAAEPPAPPPVPETPPAAEPPAPPKTDLKPLGAAAHVFLAVKGNLLDDAQRALLAQIKPGGVWLEPDGVLDETQAKSMTAAIKEAVGMGSGLNAPPLIVIAQEGGPAANPLGLENAPGAEELGRAADMAAAEATGKRAGVAARDRGIAIVAAPVLDVFRPDVSDPAIKERLFGESIDVVKNTGLAFAAGVLAGGALPMAKYYPGLGAAERQENGSLAIRLAANANTPKQQSEIRQLAEMMFPFSEAAAAKLPAMLVAHVAVPALDPEFPDLPATASPKLVQRLLREQWKYDGVLLADDLLSSPLAKDQPLEKAAVAALTAGCDAVLLRAVDAAQIQALCEALKQEIPEERLNASRERLEALCNHFAEHPAPEPAPQEPPAAAEPPAPEPVPAQEPAAEKPVAETAPPETPEPASPATPPAAEPVVVTEAANAGETPAPEPKTENGNEKESAPVTAPKENEPAPAETAVAPEEKSEPAKEQAANPPTKKEPAAQPPNTRLVTHSVQRGETLMAIGRTYKVSAAELMAWNGITDPNKIKFGQPVKVYVPENAPLEEASDAVPETAVPAPETTAPEEGPAAEEAAPETSEAPAVEPAPEGPANDTGFEYYTIRRGDTLDKIARKHRVPKEALLEMNTISNPDVLPMGTRIKVPKK